MITKLFSKILENFFQKNLGLKTKIGEDYYLQQKHFNLGRVYLADNNFKLAKKHLNKAINERPDKSEPLLYLSIAYKNAGDDSTALRLLKNKILKNNQFALREKIQIFLRKKRIQTAKNIVLEGIKKFPENPFFFKALQEILVREKKFRYASQILFQSISKFGFQVFQFKNLELSYWMGADVKEIMASFLKNYQFRKYIRKKIFKVDPKFTFISSEILGGIGPMSLLDPYVKAMQLGIIPKMKLYLLAKEKIANHSYLKYWEKYIDTIHNPQAIESLIPIEQIFEEKLNYGIIIRKKAYYIEDAIGFINKKWEKERKPPLLKLKEADSQKGWDILNRVGIPKTENLVTLHVREAGFWNQKENSSDAYRNADINSYMRAVDEIVRQGGFVVRMGDKSMQPLKNKPGFFDYACSPLKSEWMDIFLCASSKFFLGSNSGLCLVPFTFGVPCVLTNWLPLGTRPRSSKDFFIPKLLYSHEKKRILTFEESMKSPLGQCFSSTRLKELNVVPIDNNEEDILDVVKEMLEGQNPVERNNMFVLRFNKIYKKHFKYVSSGRIGKRFCEKYSHLL